MSYCGACGTFYWEGCPRRPDSVCAPAPNPYDQEHQAALAAISAANAQIAGMIAENAAAGMRGRLPPITPEHFAEVAARMTAIIQMASHD